MERYAKLKHILQKKECFKLVCGAGNEDAEEVRRLSVIYTLAGSTILDLSANVDIVAAAKSGIDEASRIASRLGKRIRIRPYLNVSIGLKGDPHVRKAGIDIKRCTRCGKCLLACKQEAITDGFIVAEYKCIGCGHCESACADGAVKFMYKRADIDKILPRCVEEGAETMELHAVTEDDNAVFADWDLLNNTIKNNFLSMCLDRSVLSNKSLIDRVKTAYEKTGERLIIQADGIPMSGEEDDYNSTLQAVACADIVQKSGIPAMVLLSGGTNTKTGLLAKQCGVTANGVAIGSFARKIVREFIRKDGFDEDMSLIKKAVSVAEELIRSNIEAING